jgi:hypothetical protein
MTSTKRLGKQQQQQERAKKKVACHNCHRRKIKCSGSSPCDRCIGYERKCTYEPEKKKRVLTKRIQKQQQLRPKASMCGRCTKLEHQLELSVSESSLPDGLPCSRCGKFDNPQRILICDGCEDQYHTSCVGLKNTVPPGMWFCKHCSTSPDKKHCALLNLFRTWKEGAADEELDSADEMQKGLATQIRWLYSKTNEHKRKENLAWRIKAMTLMQEAARYVLRICHYRSTFGLTILPGS